MRSFDRSLGVAVKYTVSIEIALPREKVAQLLADPAHLPMWLRGVVLHEPLSGVHGQVGTQWLIVYSAEPGSPDHAAMLTLVSARTGDHRD
ncbi:hypothetical protein [Kibdelosporangium phytohabitans]|uniref:hypothetical protein n=1 Tax=Kibdelosporangium phytohabitans TaxID=860235 RepID=UPI0009F85D84|nr:hypothetical protein [Kibdelosporangium phytohabitans]MBE1468872.1 uncharacterized protein YndB with AHSA1/START domain [Kibdelosporangium phytohabitans]